VFLKTVEDMKIEEKLADLLVSISNSKKFLDELDLFKRKFFTITEGKGTDISSAIEEIWSGEKREIMKKYFENSSNFNESADYLRDYILKLPKVSLTLAIQPRNEFLNRLYLWMKEHAGNNMLLDISIDPKIIGGLVLSYKGNYINKSLSVLIDRYFMTEGKEYAVKLL